MDHAYNDPSLSPLQFLLAVLHDPTVDMDDRIKAAEAAFPYVSTNPHQASVQRWEDLDPMDRVKIVIGGLPEHVSVSVEQHPPRLADPAPDNQ
jgi:hypothetical protein